MNRKQRRKKAKKIKERERQARVRKVIDRLHGIKPHSNDGFVKAVKWQMVLEKYGKVSEISI